MSGLEETLLNRWLGARILIASFLFGVLGVSPLLLYIAFGPKDGNPIGLGLLAVAAVPIAAIGMLAGLVKLLVEIFLRRGK